MRAWAKHPGRGAAIVTALLVAAAPAMSLAEVVQLPPAMDGTSLPGNAAWLEAVDPGLGEGVLEAAAVRPPGLPQRGGGVVLAHGVRFDTAARARAAWEAVRAAVPDDGTRYDVAGFGDVHAHRRPLLAGTALVDYHRLVGTDIYVVQVRVDGPEEVSDVAREVLAWHVEHTGGGAAPGTSIAVWVAALAALGIAAVAVQRWRGLRR